MKFNITFAASKTGHAGVVELVDTLDLGSSVARLGGSSPFARYKSRGSHLMRGGFFLIEKRVSHI